MKEKGRRREWREDVLEGVVFRYRQETGEGCRAAGSDSGTENGEAQKTRNSKHGFKMILTNIVMMTTMMTMMTMMMILINVVMMTVMKVCERVGVLTLPLGHPHGMFLGSCSHTKSAASMETGIKKKWN